MKISEFGKKDIDELFVDILLDKILIQSIIISYFLHTLSTSLPITHKATFC